MALHTSDLGGDAGRKLIETQNKLEEAQAVGDRALAKAIFWEMKARELELACLRLKRNLTNCQRSIVRLRKATRRMKRRLDELQPRCQRQHSS